MDIALTNESDIDIVNGDLRMLTGVAAVAQQILIRLRFFRGEWFLDEREGMPHFDVTFEKVPISAVESLFRQAVRTTPGVASVQKIQVTRDPQSRQGRITVDATATTGEPITFDSFIVGDL